VLTKAVFFCLFHGKQQDVFSTKKKKLVDVVVFEIKFLIFLFALVTFFLGGGGVIKCM